MTPTPNHHYPQFWPFPNWTPSVQQRRVLLSAPPRNVEWIGMDEAMRPVVQYADRTNLLTIRRPWSVLRNGDPTDVKGIVTDRFEVDGRVFYPKAMQGILRYNAAEEQQPYPVSKRMQANAAARVVRGAPKRMPPGR